MQFTAKPGQGEALAAELVAVAQGLQGTPGCEQYIVSRVVGSDDQVCVSERWRSQELLAQAEASAQDNPHFPAVMGLLDADTPPVRTDLTPVGGVGLLPAPRTGVTHRNLLDSEDQAPAFGLGAMGESRFPREDFGLEHLGFGHFRMKPGARQPFGHRHAEAEELYLVLAGSGRVRVDEQTVELAPRDAIRVGPEVTRAFQAGPEGLELLAVGPRHPGDGELFQGWWED